MNSTMHVTCPGCGLSLPFETDETDTLFHASKACLKYAEELSFYTLSLGDPDFLHQVVVDTYAASHQGPHSKPIQGTFALIGLYLFLECGYTGKKVQQAHMFLAGQSKTWPMFPKPKKYPVLTTKDVLEADLSKRNEMISKWAQAVWDIWEDQHDEVRKLVKKYMSGVL